MEDDYSCRVRGRENCIGLINIQEVEFTEISDCVMAMNVKEKDDFRFLLKQVKKTQKYLPFTKSPPDYLSSQSH